MAIDTGGPAFPNEGGAGHLWNDKGMTLRDYFAAKAMAALLSRSGPYGEDQKPICREDVFTVDELAEYAYAQADAMLTIRSVPDNAEVRGA